MKSKYVGKNYNGWKCTKIMLTTTRGGGTNHNYYRYRLERMTGDGKFLKVMTVGEKTMRKISRGFDPNITADNKKQNEMSGYEVLYKFVD